MNIKLTSTQVNVLLRLLISGEEPRLSDVKSLNAGQRKQLVDAGLIEVEKRTRRTLKNKTTSVSHLILTDKAWGWANENLGHLTSYRLSVSAALVRQLLSKLKTFMDKTGTPLVEILAAEPEERKPISSDVEAQIQAAYLKASGGKWNTRVRLADLRRMLPSVSRSNADAALRNMLIEEKLVLFRMDDPLEITSDDEQSAIEIGGDLKHIIYIEG